MKPIVTYSQLKQLTPGAASNSKIAAIIERSEQREVVDRYSQKEEATYDTFLSHSSKDKDLLPNVMTVLENAGGRVYCDLADERLPKKPSKHTGSILRDEIRLNKRLVVLITPRSKDSRWVPWEMGIADAALGDDNVALFPIAEFSNNNEWTEQEYLGLYRKIIYGKLKGRDHNEWLVHDDHTQLAISLDAWCGKTTQKPMPFSPRLLPTNKQQPPGRQKNHRW